MRRTRGEEATASVRWARRAAAQCPVSGGLFEAMADVGDVSGVARGDGASEQVRRGSDMRCERARKYAHMHMELYTSNVRTAAANHKSTVVLLCRPPADVAMLGRLGGRVAWRGEPRVQRERDTLERGGGSPGSGFAPMSFW